jgi:N-acetylglucosaminyl-diphospho-decaprenol L-rhamnosyltransferase
MKTVPGIDVTLAVEARTLPRVIAVVVLTFAAPPGMLEDCLASLRASSPVPDDEINVYVVDNGTMAARRLAARPELGTCTLITSIRNSGFAGGMNIGIERALADGAHTVVILNDDVVVDTNWLAPLMTEFTFDDRVGAVQPKLLIADSEPALINSLGVRLGADGAGLDIGIGELDTGENDARPIELFTGGAVALRASFLREVGMFDERFFLYYEDVDLGLRGTERGWTYRCAPASRVMHRGSATTSSQPDRTAYLRERNRLWILVRHRPIGDVARGFWLSVRRVRHHPRRVHLRALIAGVGAIPRLLISRIRAPKLST